VIVLGGLGLFGRAAVEQLRCWGVAALAASRRDAADLQIDANDPRSLRAALAAGDVVVDAAGPFQSRSTALLDAAMEIGFDVVDINDDVSYAQTVLALEDKIARAGIRVLSSASSVSAVSAAVVRTSGLPLPARVTALLAPASRHTANPGSALSLIRSVGRPVRVLRDGKLQIARGWGESCRFRMPRPIGPIRGWLFESADAVCLPCIWPSLMNVEMYVDANTPGVSLLLRLAAHWEGLRRLLESQIRLGTRISRRIGSSAGGLGYEIEDVSGQVARLAILSATNSFIVAVAPTALAARAIALDQFEPRGLVRPDRHVEPSKLFDYLESMGVHVVKLNDE
jgi:hypothetical protein